MTAIRIPQEFSLEIGDVELAVVEWQGSGDPVLLLHATGFHSRCWNQVVKELPGRHVYAVDLRFHGGSGAVGEVDWQVLTEDIRTLIEQLDLHNLVAAGHSIGGHLLARVSAILPERFKQLLLIDPVILAPEDYQALQQAGRQEASDHPVSHRKNRWIDANEMYQRFCDREPFSTWQDAVLRDYCDYALRPNDEEEYAQLACDPINEASIYIRQEGNEVIHQLLPKITIPVTLLRAKAGEKGAFDFSMSPTWPELASALPQCREIYLPQMNHFIPMQDPALVASYIREALEDRWQRNG